MRVDVIHVAGFDRAVCKGHTHRSHRSVAVPRGRRYVERVTADTVAGDLGVDLGPAGQRGLTLLEHQDARTLAYHEPVAPGIERTAGPLGFFVARRQGLHRTEAGERQRRDRRLGAAGNHRLGIAVTDQTRGLADRVGSRRAGRGAGHIRALGAEHDGDQAGGHVDDHAGDEERRDPPRTTVAQDVVLLLQKFQPADPRPDVDADAFRVSRVDPICGVVQRLTRGGHGVVGEGVHPADVFAVHSTQRIETAQFSGEAAGVVAGIELGDRSDTALAREHPLPRRLAAEAQR